MESMRVMPPIPLMLRIAARTDYIDGVLVPKGTIIQIPVIDPPLITTRDVIPLIDSRGEYLERDLGRRC